MNPYLIALIALLSSLTSALAERPYYNDLPVPETLKDIQAIEKSLKAALPKTRAATVSISLDGGFGSGVIISKEGLILTAAHVSGKVGRELTVITEDGRRVKAVSLGLVSTTDCAMMRIIEEGDKPWPFVEYDQEKTSKLGDWVFALGHLGGFDKERGVVVRIGRLIKMGDDTLGTDCQLLGGDSGGPLFNMNGLLVGIHSRVAKNKQGNMHVPMQEFLRNWDAMLASEFVGDGPFAKKPEVGNAFLGAKLEAQEGRGLVVLGLFEKGPAQEAGLQKGDLLEQLDGELIEDHDLFKADLKKKAVGDKITLTYRRGGREDKVKITLGSR